ncbi:MAG: MraY family glycosyltransferase, partial [bacterium]
MHTILPQAYWEIIALSFFVALVSTPVWIWFARRLGAVDQPAGRKIHDRPIPYLGGFSFHASFSVALVYVMWRCPFLVENAAWQSKWIILFVGSSLILLLGIYDDLRGMSPQMKFVVQILVALLLVAFGFRFERVTNPFGGGIIQLGFWGWFLSVFWIVAIANALNLVDGLDGLAAGVVFF